jgi:hypothetical protein
MIFLTLISNRKPATGNQSKMHAQCAVGMQRTPGIQFRLNYLHLGCRINLLLLLLPQRISVTLTGSFQHAPASSELLPWLPNRDRAWLKKLRKENEKVMNWNQLHTFIKALNPSLPRPSRLDRYIFNFDSVYSATLAN